MAKDFAEMFVNERAKVAKALNKPFILEETGKDVISFPNTTRIACAKGNRKVLWQRPNAPRILAVNF